MKVALLTLTRDRLEYTQHCFGALVQHAGCRYDHYVLDQGSRDGTVEWLTQKWRPAARHHRHVVEAGHNLGIHRGWNELLDRIEVSSYDVVATFDNDCELVQPGTLSALADAVHHTQWLLSPTVRGLLHPPAAGAPQQVGAYMVAPFACMGGICRAAPRAFMHRFRFNEDMPLWGGDELHVGQQATARGFGSGYLTAWHVNHFETTAGQRERYPEYFERKDSEYAGVAAAV